MENTYNTGIAQKQHTMLHIYYDIRVKAHREKNGRKIIFSE